MKLTTHQPHQLHGASDDTGTPLSEQHERFRLLVESVRDYAIFLLDGDGRVASWNEGARRFKGYEAHEIIGQHFSKFYPPEDIESGKVEEEIRIAMADGRVEDEGWRVRQDGTRFWANVVITRLDDKEGRPIGFSKVTRDLTERKRMEDEIRTAKDDLEKKVSERTQALEKAVRARDDFMSIASHELKTPLTALQLQAQITSRNLARHGEIDRASVFQFAAQINKQVNRLHQLVEDMLDVTRIQRGTLLLRAQETDLSALASEVASRFEPEMNSVGCKLSVQIEPGIQGIWDRNRIEQVLLNLLSNASKYGAGKPVTLKVSAQNETAFISVEDQGIGISPRDQGRIFDRFERAISASETSGLGLGLYIAREILESHRGQISVESELGRGTRFLASLPLKPLLPDRSEVQNEYEF